MSCPSSFAPLSVEGGRLAGEGVELKRPYNFVAGGTRGHNNFSRYKRHMAAGSEITPYRAHTSPRAADYIHRVQPSVKRAPFDLWQSSEDQDQSVPARLSF
jgi:hypothetical protein